MVSTGYTLKSLFFVFSFPCISISGLSIWFTFGSPKINIQKNLTYIIVPGLLDILDWCDLLSFLLGGFGLFGSLVLRLSLGLLLSGFRLPLGLCGWYRCRSWCRGLGWLFGSSGCKWAAAAGSGKRFLRLGLDWLGTLLTGGFVERALLTGWRLVTGRAHWLVLGRWMRNRKWRIVETTSGHEPLGLAVET